MHINHNQNSIHNVRNVIHLSKKTSISKALNPYCLTFGNLVSAWKMCVSVPENVSVSVKLGFSSFLHFLFWDPIFFTCRLVFSHIHYIQPQGHLGI